MRARKRQRERERDRVRETKREGRGRGGKAWLGAGLLLTHILSATKLPATPSTLHLPPYTFLRTPSSLHLSQPLPTLPLPSPLTMLPLLGVGYNCP